MAHFMKLALVFCAVAAAYGASIGPVGLDDSLQSFSFQAPNDQDHLTSSEEMNNFDFNVAPNRVSLAQPQENLELGRVIVEVARTALNVIQRMEISEQNIQSLMKLLTSLLEPYFGSQYQVIMPVLSGIATALYRSLSM